MTRGRLVIGERPGSGTSSGALGAGVPLLMLPLLADQSTNAKLVDAAGAGLAAGGTHSAETNFDNAMSQLDPMRGAVSNVLHDSS